MLGFGLGLQNNPTQGFDPVANLSSGATALMFWDASDISTLFQDRAGTIPVTAPGQLVGMQLDKGTHGLHKVAINDAARGTLRREPVTGVRNLFRNSLFAGFTIGVLPNSNPVSEGVTLTGSGVNLPSVEVVSSNGTGDFDVRVFGTNSTGAERFLSIFDGADVPVTPGMTRVVSGGLQVLSNTGPNTPTVNFYTHCRDAGGALITSGDSSVTPTGVMVHYSTTLVVPAGSTRIVNKGLYMRINAGQTVDYTLRIRRLQVELGSVETPFQKTRQSGNDVTEDGQRSIWSIKTDGINTGYVTPSIDPGVDKVQVFAGLRKLSDAALGLLLESSASIGANNGAMALVAPLNSTGSTFGFGSKGTVFSAWSVSGALFAAPSTVVLTGIGDISANAQILLLNGSEIQSLSNDQGTGNYGNHPLYFYRRGGTVFPFNGQSSIEIVRFGDNLSPELIAQTERFIASRTGVTL